MELRIERKYRKETYTIGKLFIDGVYFCDTLEDKDRGLAQFMNVGEIQNMKVYGETAIPTGRYKVVINYSKAFKRKLPQVMLVKGFDGIRIHRGNTNKDTYGCILVGKNTAKGMVLDSAITEIALVKILSNADEINLTIE